MCADFCQTVYNRSQGLTLFVSAYTRIMLIDSMTISVGGGGTGGRHVLCMLAVSSALVLGFTLGNLAACRRRQQELHDEELRHPRNSTKGAKRKARIRKSEDNSRTKAAGLKSPSPSSGDQSRNKQLSRRTRNRSKKLAPKDLALDAFTKIAHSHIDCIGRGDFQSLCLLPRTAFIVAGRFVAHSSCRDRLVTLGQARAAAAGVDDLRILYVSCSWASAGGAQGDWASKDFETTRAFLEQHPDLAYVYVGRSCVSRASDGPERAAQLRHVPLVLLRADVVLVLPPASEHSADLDAVSEPSKRRPRYSDFNLHTRIAWSRMELAVAAVGQAKVYVAFRAEPFPESVCELNSGQVEVKEVTRQAANTLRAAAAVTVDMGRASEMHEERYSSGSAAALEATVQRGVTDSTATTVVVEAACENWLGSALNHLTALEDARTVVVAAEKSSDDSVLQSIWKMRPTPNADFTMVARESLGQEAVEGAKGLALSILLFTVLCSQPKERATYTDGFLEDAGNVRITYRPIAVVRSPYRERFGTPRQPQVTASVLHGRAEEGEIVFLKGHGYGEHALSAVKTIVRLLCLWSSCLYLSPP